MIWGFLIRVALAFLLSTYENVYEQDLRFTDIDYKVYSDASLTNNPYDRHTYRYSPLLAYLMRWNYSLHQATGKVLLAVFDLAAMVLLYSLVARSDPIRKTAERNATLAVRVYAYNPLFIALTVRGSC